VRIQEEEEEGLFSLLFFNVGEEMAPKSHQLLEGFWFGKGRVETRREVVDRHTGHPSLPASSDEGDSL
jgi:hypothetical protein